MGGSQWGLPCFLGRQPPYLIAEREKVDDYVVKKKLKLLVLLKMVLQTFTQ